MAAAEQLYDALYQWNKRGSLSITQTSLAFFSDLDSAAAIGEYEISSPTYLNLTKAVRSYADSFIAIVQKYTPADGSLAEQFGRDSGLPVSAAHLTWSYAAFLTAISRRDGIVPNSWGSPSSNARSVAC